MALPEKGECPAQQVQAHLELVSGDIVFSELPFEDASQADFTHFENLIPGHTCVWISYETGCGFVRAFQEGYQPPGLTLTDLWVGRHAVYRYLGDAEVVDVFAMIMRNWAASDIPAPSVPREKTSFWSAANDLFALFKNQNLATLGSEGVRRAIKYAARRAVVGEPDIAEGQRCTAVVAAAFQASILAVIVKQAEQPDTAMPEKGSLFLEYADTMLTPGWRDHPMGQRLLFAANNNDYSMLFPEPFNIDQRYATPKQLYEKLRQSDEFRLIGHYSYFDGHLISIEKPFHRPQKTLR